MNAKTPWYTKYIKLLLYVLVIVLVNVAGLTLFSRVDLTQNGIYSLSEVSQQVVSTLSEPMTLKVFFTKNLPAPHNNTEFYLRDLLKEYALHNKKYFHAQFYDVSPESEGVSDKAHANREMAREYGINPVQIQLIEKDEVKFTQAYMGLVLIHGDIIERVPTITSTDGLEYKLTTAIQKLNNKVSALLALKEKVDVKLYLSSSIYKVAPYMNIKEMDQYAQKIKQVVEGMNATTYGKLAFSHIDPNVEKISPEELEKLNVMQINWPEIAKADVAAGNGAIGLVMSYKSAVRSIPLLSVMRIPLFGNQYQLTEVGAIEELLNTNLDRLININTELGYLANFGTLDLGGANPMGGPPDGEALNQFSNLIGKTYDIKPVDLTQSGVPDGLKSLVIARPTEKLDDYALYQIDQALMRGTNLIVFADAFQEIRPPAGQPMMGNQPMFIPSDTGLEKLLDHYGVRIQKALVMDENCYRQRLPQEQGGGEQPFYFAPIIQSEHMSKELDYVKNIKALVTVKVSPLELNAERIQAQKIIAHELFGSSKRSWEMRDQINLNPRFIQPPASDNEMRSRPLAYLLEGSFSSYFKGKPIPEKPPEKPIDKKPEQPEGAPSEETLAQPPAQPPAEPVAEIKAPEITPTGALKEQSPTARIFVVGCSEILKDSLLDNEGETTNALFVLNMIDALNGREATAVMHSKIQQFNPVEETAATTKTMVKTANMVGLPILVVLFGVLVWWRRHVRKKMIQLMFLG